MKKTLKYVLAAAVIAGSVSSLASCGWKNPGQKGVHTYNTYTTVSPSNWNELTYKDNNDTQIMSYIGSSFFGYDFKFDSNGKIVPGEFEVTYNAATALEDVTATYAGNAKYAVPADAEGGYAYKITLREDLKWDDGSAIDAADFVYSMKEQLNPLFKNYRADSFYNGALVIHGAKDYVYQGTKGWFPSTMAYSTYSPDIDDKLVFSLGSSAAEGEVINTLSNGKELVGNGTKAPSYFRTWLTDQLGTKKVDAWYVAYVMVSNWLKDLTPEQIVALENKTLAEIKADPELKATWDRIIGWWQTKPNEELHFFAAEYEFPAVNFDDVGIFVGNKANEIVLVLDNPLELLKEDGSLSYKAAYNFGSLPLVKEDLYETNKVAPVQGADLWTSTYNQSVDSTASWGPYKLTTFQSGKQYILERNEHWYGYNLPENEGLYQTDRIVCETVKDWNTAWLLFQQGGVTSIGVDVSIAPDYKNSLRALFTPSDFVGSMQLQSDKDALKLRESDGVNKTLLTYKDFRKAISLAIDRDAYNQTCTTASKAGFGLFNSMHYYDVENGGVYRNEDVAKEVLVDVYGVDQSKFDSLDDAHAAINGYDLTQARALVEKAYAEAKANGDIKDTDKVSITFGSGDSSEVTMRVYNFLSDAIKEMVKGTVLEGRIETNYEDHQEKWADDFRAGKYDVCTGGWSGAAWDPGYFLLAYLSPDYMYSTGWDTSSAELTYQVKGYSYVNEDGETVNDPTFTMSLLEWYDCLNGATSAPHNWADGEVATDIRLGIIAALEKEILSVYYTVPISNSYSATLLSYKVDYITTEYNTFMSYGGIKYMTYNYDDYEWAEYTHKNTIDYKA